MPTYVYKCDSCGAQFEQFQSFKDEPVRICPVCASAVRRVFQPVGIVFKGSGWYVTDSRKSSSATLNSDDAPKTEKAGETKADGSAETKTDTKIDTKTETKTESTTPAASASATTPTTP